MELKAKDNRERDRGRVAPSHMKAYFKIVQTFYRNKQQALEQYRGIRNHTYMKSRVLG